MQGQGFLVSATGDLDGFASQSTVGLRIDLGGMGCSGVGWVRKKGQNLGTAPKNRLLL